MRSYRGAAEPVHGHSWRVVARLETSGLDEDGLAFDFVEIKRALDDLAGRLDHGEINRVPPFDVESPSTERVAAWFFDELAARLPSAPLAAVTLFEGPDCSATYRPGSE
ncbi:MAG: 6-carboxytetrahydropterin synthase [Acidobacteria bacterium]|nr:6-carboxytetrahydropterin synthase [Acidobacteriota bacterium]MCB9378580.1 6-carboxytetrahydropterin synthase [Holophagales bacterium]